MEHLKQTQLSYEIMNNFLPREFKEENIIAHYLVAVIAEFLQNTHYLVKKGFLKNEKFNKQDFMECMIDSLEYCIINLQECIENKKEELTQ